MTICCVVGCSSRSELTKTTNISLHKFPKDDILKEAWTKAVRRLDWKPSNYSVICSLHFEEKWFNRELKILKLRKGAIPTLFPSYPSYYQNQKVNERPLVTRNPASMPTPSTSEILLLDDPQESLQEEVNLLRDKLQKVSRQLLMARRKIKTLQQGKRRYNKKRADLESVISSLKKKNFINDDNLELLCKIPGPNNELLKRQLAKELGKPLPSKYSEELRAFALTLHYFSPRAYRYVRKVFNTCLPHERTIKKWYQSTDGKPGFTTEAFDVLKQIVSIGKSKVPAISYVWNLVIDEIAIRKQIEFDGKEYHGFQDFGTGVEDDSVPVAKGALAFMLVCINSNWKLPVGYFLIESVNSNQLSNLVSQALTLSSEVGVDVVNITFDGTATNVAMAHKLGCCFEASAMNSLFPHPETDKPVSIMLDACHMIKLVRNTLGDKDHMVDKDGGVIKWIYIQKLHELQELEGVHLANKLRKAHIEWVTQRMKVKLAVQVFSESVADAIELCRKMGLSDFQNSEATIKFIRIINKLFDVLNSRSLLQQKRKQPLTNVNFAETSHFLEETWKYIDGLTDLIGTKIVCSNRKTGFLGFQICIKSTINLFERLVGGKQLKFLPMYKFSQDHLELFFGSIRALGGCNNNPTARQFKSAYKKLLVHCELFEDSRGNCLKLENIPILQSSKYSNIVQQTSEELINLSSTRTRYSDEEESGSDELVDDDFSYANFWLDHDYVYDVEKLTTVCETAVGYIAGFVVKKLETNLKCEPCISALREPRPSAASKHAFSLIEEKNRGGLIYPSLDVIKVCFRCEKLLRKSLIKKTATNEELRINFLQMLSGVLEYFVGENIFESLNEHMYEQEINHTVNLIKAIANKYFDIRVKYWCKQLSANLIDKKKRNLFTKLILFRGE